MSIIKLNNRSVKNATAFGSGVTSLGSMTFIKKLTASSSATLSFVDGSSSVVLDNTYKEYLFTFNNIHPATNGEYLSFQGSTDTGSSYGVNITSSAYRARHYENDSNADLAYNATFDLAQSTDFNKLIVIGNGNDESASGTLHLFNPSSTTFVKHFICRTNGYHSSDFTHEIGVAGYFNTTSAIDAIQFKMSSGNIDAGDICLYGIN
tara:strand:+ start:452 stop:1072 length:621 start_codon:yes stop_codon:yes gene_type:complete